jgi:hypothetical protein
MGFFGRCVAIAVLLASLFGGCGKENGPPAEKPGIAAEMPSSGLWVTFDVNGERFRAQVTRPESIRYVIAFLEGDAPQRVPNGLIQRGGKFNSRWSWNFEPGTVEFADVTMEACDAAPSYIETHLDDWLDEQGRRYCPWSARIVGADDCRSGECAALTL